MPLALLCLVLAARLPSAQAAVSEDLIGSLFRAQYECTSTDSCPDNLLDPIQPELAATLRSIISGTADDAGALLTGRRLLCQSFTNPVLNTDFADPAEPIIGQDGLMYSYATNALGFNIQYATATSIGAWTHANADALPDNNGFPSWASSGGYTWAPAVINIGGVFNMYFTARSTALGTQCIGRATSAVAAGPFQSSSPAPIVCQPTMGGTIDAQPFQDADGSLYLVYKNDGNSRGEACNLWIQALSADGSTVTGTATVMVTNDASSWEGTVIEAPYIEPCQGGKYCLFYSANNYATCSYSVGVAVADSVLGPYTKDPSNPVLAAEGNVCGPGGQSPFQDSGPYSAIHTWNNNTKNYRPMSMIGTPAADGGYFDQPTLGANTCQ